MKNYLLDFFDKDSNLFNKIQTLDDLKAWISTEELITKKKHFQNQKLKLLNFDSEITQENINSELFFVFNKIYSLKVSLDVKKRFIVKVLNIYNKIISKEEILLFLTSYWHINGSTWQDFNFLFTVWLKFLRTDILLISEKSIELIWLQDALLNINTEKKLENFLLELPSFIKLIDLAYYLLSDALSYINKKPDHEVEQASLFSQKIVNLIINQFYKYEDQLLEKILIDLLDTIINTSNLDDLAEFAKILRANIKTNARKRKKYFQRLLYFLQQTWQKRLLTYSHFLEFVFLAGKNVTRRRNNQYVNFIIGLYHNSFLQLNQIINLLDDKKITSLLSFKTKMKIFEVFDTNPDAFADIRVLEFYLRLKKSYYFFNLNLQNFFQIIFSNPICWQSYISFYILQSQKSKKKYFKSMLKYIDSNLYNIQFNTISEKFFEFLDKISNIVQYIEDENIKLYIYKSVYQITEKDERYSSLIPSLVLNFIDFFIKEQNRDLIIKNLLNYLSKLNPLTMNANNYRMFLRDGYRIAKREDYAVTLKEEMYRSLDSFLEGYILYSNYLIPDKEKIEFLEYLATFELEIITTSKIVSWMKSQPNLNVKIISSTGKQKRQVMEKKEQQSRKSQLVLKEIKCGSCLREITEAERKTCDFCEITLCTTCFIEFELSGDNCPGELFGNKMHKFKIRNN